MKLFLTSHTITDNLVQPFESLIGKDISGLKVAFIPDAADATPGTDKAWVEEDKQFLIDNYEWDLTTYELRDKTPNDMKDLFAYDAIWVNGGLSGYLVNIMRSSGFEYILPDLFEKGIVYCGSSAGSMVMSKTQDASSWYIGEPEPEAIKTPGLGYIDFQIYPHYEDSLYDEILSNAKNDMKYVLLRNGEAVSVADEYVAYHGENIKVINKR